MARSFDGVYRKNAIDNERIRKQEENEGLNTGKSELQKAIDSIKALGLPKEQEDALLNSLFESYSNIKNTGDRNGKENNKFKNSLAKMTEEDPEYKRNLRENAERSLEELRNMREESMDDIEELMKLGKSIDDI